MIFRKNIIGTSCFLKVSMNSYSKEKHLPLIQQHLIKRLQSKPDNLNNTKKADIEILLFNRVAKVGSQSLMELLKRLGKINNFSATRDKGKRHETVLLGPLQQEKLATDIIYSQAPPYSYSQHVAYLNFTHLKLPKPIYINLVRDPIERIISWHYYLRAPWYYEDLKRKLGDKAPPLPSKEFLDMDLETCIKTKNIYCQFNQGDKLNPVGDHRRQTLFFCGQNKDTCMPFNSEGALQQAKRTVEQEYAVVGTWEDPNITLSVFEGYIPRFFKNAKIAYYLGQEKLSIINKNGMKKTVSDEVRQILRTNFTLEIEFYEFCKQRLYRQYAAMNSNLGEDDDYMLLPEVD